jgi:hypothetical protein
MDFSIGVTKEQAKAIDINGDQFICPSCQGIVLFYNENIHGITFAQIIYR